LSDDITKDANNLPSGKFESSLTIESVELITSTSV